MGLIKSTPNDIYPPQVGNSLAVFVDINDGILKFKDQNGSVNTLSAYTISTQSSVKIEGSGAGSTLRCGNNNTSLAPCSSVVGGECNKVATTGCYGSVSGGFTNSAYGIGSNVSGGVYNISGIGEGGGCCCGIGNLAISDGIGVYYPIGSSILLESCYSSIGGGCCNQSFGLASVITGGAKNIASGSYSSVNGGECNCSLSAYSSVLGGRCNLVCHAYSSAIGCGITTTASCTLFTNNLCTISNVYVGGLTQSCAVCVGANGRLVGYTAAGSSIYVAGTGGCSIVAYGNGGLSNCATQQDATVLGGVLNSVTACQSTIMQGRQNSISGNYNSHIINGCNNKICCITGACGFCYEHNGIIGGCFNSIVDTQYSFIGTPQNTAICKSGYSGIVSGSSNCIINSSQSGFIGTGISNQIICTVNGTILNGQQNKICGGFSCYNTISNGYNNVIDCNNVFSIIANGCNSAILSSTINNTIINGCTNVIGGKCNSAIINGRTNTISGTGCYGFVGSGQSNTISGYSGFSTLSNGNANSISKANSFIGTGWSNTIAGGSFVCNGAGGFIGAGCFNCTTGDVVFIGNGISNLACGCFSYIGNGCANSAQSVYGAILGGQCNVVGSLYPCSMIVGSNITADRTCTTFVNNLSIKSIPTSSAGLPSGSVWRCTTDNTLRIVP